jgi:hypothetical protein
VDDTGRYVRGKLTGQKPPLKLREIWAICIRLQISHQILDLALLNLVIDSNLRSCDLVKIGVRDVTHGATISRRAMVMQQKAGQPVRFEITEQIRVSMSNLDFCRNNGVIHVYHFNWIDRVVTLEAGGHYHLPGRGYYLYRNLGRAKYDF